MQFIFAHPKTKKLVIYLSDFQVEEENNITSLKNYLKQKGTILKDGSFASEIFEIYVLYVNYMIMIIIHIINNKEN